MKSWLARLRWAAIAACACTPLLLGCSASEAEGDGDDDNNNNDDGTGGSTTTPPPPPPPTPGTHGMACAYPEGVPWGVDEGEFVPVFKDWEGYPAHDPTHTAREFEITEFYDCDGFQGVDAVMFETSQYG